MTRLESSHSEPLTQTAVRTSPWAIGSIVASLLICCPLFTMLGPLLGWTALRDIARNPNRRGTGVARFGITLGILTTAISVGGYVWWHINVRQPMLHGPREALRAGFAGDLDGFRQGLAGRAATLPDEEALAFLSELAQRYGRFIGSRQDEMREAIGTVTGGLMIPYIFTFESGEVRAQAMFVVLSEGQTVPRGRFSSIIVLDPPLGDVVYPSDVEFPTLPNQADEAIDEGQ